MRAAADMDDVPRGPSVAAAAARWRATATTAVLASTGAVVALHVLRPDLDPVAHRLSEYAVGPWGWVMSAVFVLFGLGAWLVRRGIPARGRLRPVRALLAVAATGMIVSAAFETDVTTPDAVRDAIHSVASSSAFASLVVAALWTATVGRAAVVWPTSRAVSDAVAAVVVFGAVISPIAHDGPWAGAAQRVSYIALATWLLLLSCAGAAPPTSTGHSTARRAAGRLGPGSGR